MSQLPPMKPLVQEENIPEAPRKKRGPILKKKTDQSNRVVLYISIAYLVIALLVWYLISSFSEEWWLSAAFTYLPRLPWLLPAVGLLIWSVVAHRKSIPINLASIIVVLWLIMEFNIPSGAVSSPSAEHDLVIISCNVQEYQPNFQKVLNEIVRLDPDIIAFQEARDLHPGFEEQYPNWHLLVSETFVIASRYPIEKVATCQSQVFQRASAFAVKVEHPAGPFILVNMHLMTARKGLNELSLGSIFSGEGIEEVDDFQIKREKEAYIARKFSTEISGKLPMIIAGDFNMPSSSSIYQQNWQGSKNAFDTTNWGYGYTSPCRQHRLWLENTPWLRIDHILTSHHWAIHDCTIGESNGSDHHLISARISLQD